MPVTFATKTGSGPVNHAGTRNTAPVASLIGRAVLALCLVVAGGCATVDFDAPKPESFALTDTDDTRLGRAISHDHDYPDNYAGFYLLSDAIDALAARLLIADRAEKSIDAQYYLVKDDIIGRVFFASLLQAAERGVRVRLLIDDVGTQGMDEILAAVADHPNLELRLFNPFASRNARAADAWDFQRLNRRMHNKSFTVDNQITIIGGRNIATEYFAANRIYNFGDLDTLAIGPVVQDTSDMFDSFWNHPKAVPFEQLSGQEDDGGARLKALGDDLRTAIDSLRDTPYADAVEQSFDRFVDSDESIYTWARYMLVFDSPDKALGSVEGEDSIVTPLAKAAGAAQEELLVISPYFVPRKRGIEAISEMARRGVQVDIVTNGLAANDHLIVYGGYAPSRKPLLKEGVRFYEIRGDLALSGTKAAGTQKARSSLHTKAFVVDRRYFFMGSFNWDPRSAEINTELGVLMDAPDIAGEVARLIYEAAPTRSYQAFLNDDGQLNWRAVENGEEVIYTKEPESGWWRRTSANLTRLLPIRSQL